jgi:TRAP-type C4-dicarboxylate transport system substrate-binding protein
VAMSLGDVLPAIQQGTIDGADVSSRNPKVAAAYKIVAAARMREPASQ